MKKIILIIAVLTSFNVSANEYNNGYIEGYTTARTQIVGCVFLKTKDEVVHCIITKQGKVE